MSDRHVFVDPYIFCLPGFESPEHGRSYIDRLVRWGSAVFEEPDRYSTSEAAVNQLATDELYPDYSNIAMLITRCAIDYVTAYDVSNYLTVLAGRRPYLEERCGVTAVLVDTTDGVTPSEIVRRLPHRVGSILHDALFLAITGLMNGWDVGPLLFGTDGIDYGLDQAITVVGQVVLADCTPSINLELPITINREIGVLVETVGAEIEVDVTSLWEDPQRAVQAAYHLLPDLIRQGQLLPEIHVGDKFLTSLRKLGIHNQPSLIRRLYFLSAMAAIGLLEEVNGADLHPVRTSPAADASQVEVGGAKKWRCKLSQQGAGFRLHYWTRSDDSLELDSVTVESKV